MIKYNEAGQIETSQIEIKPTCAGERKALQMFAGLNPAQRAELIMLGFEYLNNLYQRNADKVTG